MAYGSRVQTPALWPIAPASHGSADAPTVEAAFITPIAVDCSRALLICGASAIVVGKIGPRKNPSSPSATPTGAAPGTSQTKVAQARTPVRQPYIIPIADRPNLVAIGLIRNRPRVSPSQYPLIRYPASDGDSDRLWTR